jgi:hypothetical protein
LPGVVRDPAGDFTPLIVVFITFIGLISRHPFTIELQLLYSPEMVIYNPLKRNKRARETGIINRWKAQ